MRLCAYPYRKQGKNHPKLDLIREENDLQDRFLHMMYSHAAGGFENTVDEEPRCSRWFSHLYLVRQAAFWAAAYRCRWLHRL